MSVSSGSTGRSRTTQTTGKKQAVVLRDLDQKTGTQDQRAYALQSSQKQMTLRHYISRQSFDERTAAGVRRCRKQSEVTNYSCWLGDWCDHDRKIIRGVRERRDKLFRQWYRIATPCKHARSDEPQVSRRTWPNRQDTDRVGVDQPYYVELYASRSGALPCPAVLRGMSRGETGTNLLFTNQMNETFKCSSTNKD